MSAEERIARIFVKIDRADEHIANVELAIAAFLLGNPYTVVANRDFNTNEIVYAIGGALNVPLPISAIAGDAIQNLRSALDHLAQHLFAVGSSGGSPDVSFPTDISPAQHRANSRGKVKGWRQDAIDILDAIEPYMGGHGEGLSILNRLNRIDKHRMLFAVGSAFREVDIGSDLQSLIKRHTKGVFGNDVLSFRIKPTDRLCPIKVGDVLFRSGLSAEINPNVRFTFEVSINETGLAEDQPLVPTLKRFSALVRGTVEKFRPCLN